MVIHLGTCANMARGPAKNQRLIDKNQPHCLAIQKSSVPKRLGIVPINLAPQKTNATSLTSPENKAL
jgi:hypothetical protein